MSRDRPIPTAELDAATAEAASVDETSLGNPTFVSEPLEPGADFIDSPALAQGEPPLPRRFRWRDSDIVVAEVVRAWRSTKTDRGDAYLSRHWFEVKTSDGKTAVVYFDRKARRDAARWWLYTIGESRGK